MRVRPKGLRAASCLYLVAAVMALTGCGEVTTKSKTMAVDLHGELRVPPGADGPVHVAVYHAWSGRGELRHPLQFIVAFTATPGAYRHAIEYPVDAGEGLVVYAWVDLDGDGVLCTPSYRMDLSGLTEAKSFPGDSPQVDVDMTAPCRGPDWFFPPEEPLRRSALNKLALALEQS
jgi:hypothetical protein